MFFKILYLYQEKFNVHIKMQIVDLKIEKSVNYGVMKVKKKKSKVIYYKKINQLIENYPIRNS